MESWSDQVKQVIKTNLGGIKERDLRFFRIDEFIRNIERTEKFYETCPECFKHKNDISAIAGNIREAIKAPGEKRRELDRLTGKISRHMTTAHKFYTPYHFTYLYSFFGMVTGLLLGFFGTKVYPSEDWIALVIGFIAGLLTGQFIGAKKDRAVRKNKQLM